MAALCLALVMPASAAQGPGTSKTSRRPPIEVADIVLDSQGGLRGVVIDVNGAPQAETNVVLVQERQEVGRVRTDRQGRFRIAGLRAGVYMLQTGGQGRFVRAWTSKAAPPAARPIALMVSGDGVVRGQMPLEQFFASDAVVIAGLVAAVIAIPIAVSNQGSSSPASP